MPRSLSRRERFRYLCRTCWPAMLVLVAGGAISVSAFLDARRNDTLRLQSEFTQFASERNNAVLRNLNTFADIVGSVRLLHYKSGGMDRDDFRVMAEPLLQHHPGIQALEWVPRVPDAQRARYERNARRIGNEDFRITERGPEGMVPRKRQDEYFPVYYVCPLEGNVPAIGFDLASEPLRRAALEKARDTGKAVTTPRLDLVQKTEDAYGILLLLPVHRKPDSEEDDRPGTLLGFVAGVFNAQGLIEVSLSGFSPEGIDLEWLDITDPASPVSLGGWDSEGGVYRMHRDHSAPVPVGFVQDLDFELGGRTWRVRSAASPSYLAARRSNLPWLVLFGGLAFSLLVAIYLMRSMERTAKLQESESRYRTLVEFAPEAIVMLDPDKGRFVDANQNALDLFKLPLDRLLELGPIDVSPERQPDGTLSRESAPKKIGAALTGTAPFFEWLHLDSEGGEILCEVRLVRLASRRGNLLRGSITDITARRREEEERRDLEHRLDEARKLESLGLLAGGIAHDFNNLLTPILGRTDLALSELGPDHPGRRHLEDIRISAIRAGQLIEQLLASTGLATTNLTRFALNPLVVEMARLWEVSIPGVELVLDLDPSEPQIEGDESQIRQLVLNLITNAADALGGGSGTIRLVTRAQNLGERELKRFEVTPDLPPGPYVVLEVSDTGPGIAPETQSRIFDPFFSTKPAGRGLGLASLLGILRSHHGGVRVRSTPGAGATFTVILPVVQDPAADSDRSDPVSSSRNPDRIPAPASGRILVADDEAGIRTLVCAILERDGLETVAVEDGTGVLDLLTSTTNGIRLVLLDLSMPGPEGTEVITEVRRLRPDLPVVLMSGFGKQAILQRFSADGHFAYLQKPFEPERLLATVHEALDPV